MLRMIEVRSGVSLAVDVPDDIRDKKLPVIVFGNSLAADKGMWSEVQQLLYGHARMVTFDARGHGLSSTPSGPYEIDQLGTDMLALMDALSLDEAIVCGLSLGGLVGQWVAIHRPERVSGLMLANTNSVFQPASLWRDREEAVSRTGLAPMVEATLSRWLTAGYQAANPERTVAIGDMIRETRSEGYAGCCAVLANTDLTPYLDRISCRTLVITGTYDPSTTPAQGCELAKRIPSADLVEIGAAHLSAVEAPLDFAKAILNFIGRGASAMTDQ